MTALIAVAATLAACRAPARVLGPVDPQFASAFEALAGAIEVGEDDVAQRLLANILTRGPEGDTLARAEGYTRILEGRRLSRSLKLQLVVEPSPGHPRRVALHLVAQHDLPEALEVRSLPPILKILVAGVQPNGFEQRSAKSVGIDAAAQFEIPPGERIRVRLGDYPLAAGTALAVRGTYELEYPAGELVFGREVFPANDLIVASTNAVRLAEFLPKAPVEPAELLSYLRRDKVSTPAMLERAVRIDPLRRAEALDLLSVASGQFTLLQIEQAVPALRWISGNRHLGADAESWRRWLQGRATVEEQHNEGLELPTSSAR